MTQQPSPNFGTMSHLFLDFRRVPRSGVYSATRSSDYFRLSGRNKNLRLGHYAPIQVKMTHRDESVVAAFSARLSLTAADRDDAAAEAISPDASALTTR